MSDEEIIESLKDSKMRCLLAVIYNKICMKVSYNDIDGLDTIIGKFYISGACTIQQSVLYKSFPDSPHCLVNPRNTSKAVVDDIWREIANKVDKFPSILERLFKPLNISFTTHYNKYTGLISISYSINNISDKTNLEILTNLEITPIYRSLIYKNEEHPEWA
ncbi:MAG: hypothetical protein RL621_42 [Bacteroidota bacterium]|jgi:hypothetical protein